MIDSEEGSEVESRTSPHSIILSQIMISFSHYTSNVVRYAPNKMMRSMILGSAIILFSLPRSSRGDPTLTSASAFCVLRSAAPPINVDPNSKLPLLDPFT